MKDLLGSNFHFLRPLWCWALIPLLIIFMLLIMSKRNQSAWQKVCDPHLLAHLLVKQVGVYSRIPIFLLALAWFFTVFALAGPSWKQLPQPVYRNTLARIIVLDMSLLMNATDITPDRLTRAKYKVLDLLKASHEARIGMLVFTSEAFVVSPLTEDANTIALLVPTLQSDIMPVQGSNISSGLDEAAKLLTQAGFDSGQIILLTASPVKPEDLQQAAKIHQQGFTISVLGIGTSAGGPIRLSSNGFINNNKGSIVLAKLDQAALQELAKQGGGKYQDFTVDNTDINNLLETHSIKEKNQQGLKETATLWNDGGPYFIFIVLILILFVFRRSWFNEVTR